MPKGGCIIGSIFIVIIVLCLPWLYFLPNGWNSKPIKKYKTCEIISKNDMNARIEEYSSETKYSRFYNDYEQYDFTMNGYSYLFEISVDKKNVQLSQIYRLSKEGKEIYLWDGKNISEHPELLPQFEQEFFNKIFIYNKQCGCYELKK